MGRRRRRVIRIVKKKLPTVFVCPRCGEEAVRVTIAKDTGKATVMCALCQLKDEFPAHPAAQMIDVYSYFADRFYGVKDPRPIIPHEREVARPAPDEEAAELEKDEAPANALDEVLPAKEAGPIVVGPESESTPGAAAVEAVAQPSGSHLGGGLPENAPETLTAPENPDTTDEEKPSEEENEPFADILENKDKKRYSPNPLPQQRSEQTSQASD